jgi:integrase
MGAQSHFGGTQPLAYTRPKRGGQIATERQIRAFLGAARNALKPQRLYIAGGLHLVAGGGRNPVWRFKYRYAAGVAVKEATYTIGPYPGISLAEARRQMELLKGKLALAPGNLTQARDHEQAQGATLQAIAERWLQDHKPHWSTFHFYTVSQALQRDVYPALGARPIAGIKPPDLKAVVDGVLARGHGGAQAPRRETAAKLLQNLAGIFRLAQALGIYHGDNPAGPVREVLPRRQAPRRMPALLEWPALGRMLAAAAAATATTKISMVSYQAHLLCAFTACRLGNVVRAHWDEFDLQADPPTWTIPRAKMKAKGHPHDHKVILGPFIAAAMRTWQRQTGGQGWVFKSVSRKRAELPITLEAVEKIYKTTLKLKGIHSPHGWRSAFSTLAREHGFNRDAVELALDHVHDNDVVRAYDRGERLQERIKLMQWWDGRLAAELDPDRGAPAA